MIFTGGTATAFHLLGLKPSMRLFAETGGKNAMIVTAMADRDLAIKHVVQSAFGHGGQKCSATSLLILEGEIYDDEGFRRLLCDAVESLAVGSAWNPATKVGPLIRPPAPKLRAALKELEPGESWGVMPRQLEDNPNLWSPGVKWGVCPGSVTHMTEFFGPVLGVMCARNLEEAMTWVNATGYGLTSGLQSLDDREQEVWTESIRAGNLYINRGTTGAIVLRQPFGGMGLSAFGPGLKAGGPNYVASLLDFRETGAPIGAVKIGDAQVDTLLTALKAYNEVDDTTLDRLHSAALSATRWMHEEFGVRRDHARLIGQDNLRLYRPVEQLRIRIDDRDSAFETLARVCAARIAGCRICVSYRPESVPPVVDVLQELTGTWAGPIEFLEEGDAALADRIRAGQTDRVRYARPERVPEAVRRAAAETGLHLADEPVLAEGRVELLRYVYEQSLCVDYHRYGNLGARAGEPRSAVQ